MSDLQNFNYSAKMESKLVMLVRETAHETTKSIYAYGDENLIWHKDKLVTAYKLT
jgi:hypothetical protein